MTSDDPSARINRLSGIAKEIVERNKQQIPGIVAAYSDGSLARGDIVRGSDVDIGFIIRGRDRLDKTIHRELIDGVIFEWGFFPQASYENLDEILRDAGFTHDIATAKIWYDPDNFLGKIQETVREKSQSDKTIYERARGQIKRALDSYDSLKISVEAGNNRDIIQPLISIVRSLFAVPTAILNKPVTNSRAYLYCRRDAHELSIPKYPRSVIIILGTHGVYREKVEELFNLANKVYDASNFPQNRINTFKAHLEIVNYLLDTGEIEGATWPLLFWSMAWMRDLDEDSQKEELDKLINLFLPIRAAYGLVSADDLNNKKTLIEEAINQAEKLLANRYALH